MSKQSQRIDDMLRETISKKILKCPLLVFHEVMKHAYKPFVIVLAGRGYGCHMQKLRVPVQV